MPVHAWQEGGGMPFEQVDTRTAHPQTVNPLTGTSVSSRHKTCCESCSLL
jgi:hypothetical protein